MALPLASLLHREARTAGFAGGLDALLETLADLKLVVDLPAPGRRTTAVRLTEGTPVQEPLVQHFHLAQYKAALAPAEG